MGADYGGGSLTALPIIEVQAGDMSAYIPTNVISITDGQIYLETDMFNSGIRPSLNAGLSVSRVGGNAQTKAMRQVAGKLRIDMAQYRELATFAQFGTADLDKATQTQLARGQRTVEVLKQPQYDPVPLSNQVCILYAVTNGYMDDVPLDKVSAFEQDFNRFMHSNHPKVVESIVTDKEIKPETENALKDAIAEFKQSATY
jgi:F-type H+-transporting ATPase subunit alpha